MNKVSGPIRGLAWLVAYLLMLPLPGNGQEPRALDERLTVLPFASAPEVVHPIGMVFDERGRLIVIESHTHFRPPGYRGPENNRVRIVEDTDGDGRADRFSTFFEGTRFSMDIAAHPDGSIYLATRNEILRLEDADGDGHAEDSRRVVFLETRGNYPHNGLSGLCFDSQGDLFFLGWARTSARITRCGVAIRPRSSEEVNGAESSTARPSEHDFGALRRASGTHSEAIATRDGRVRSGILVRTNLDETTYLDPEGTLFTVVTPDVEDRRPLPNSIMPSGLPDLLTDKELRDLLAYLSSRQ